jgi:hypothetical protein
VILVLDCGNSRLKWGLAGPHGWISQGNIANQEIGTLALRDWQNLPRPARVVGVNVAGEATRVRVEAQLVRWRTTPEWLIAHEEAGGVYNRYARPSQLGADRWAALIAARRRVADELFPSPCVVVNAGTAVTVDALDGPGVFRGGVTGVRVDVLVADAGRPVTRLTADQIELADNGVRQSLDSAAVVDGLSAAVYRITPPRRGAGPAPLERLELDFPGGTKATW